MTIFSFPVFFCNHCSSFLPIFARFIKKFHPIPFVVDRTESARKICQSNSDTLSL
jgi:hypothetical protein